VPIVPSYLTIDAVSTSRTRIVLAGDDVLLREGLAAPAGSLGLRGPRQAGTPSELIELVREARPGLAIVDIRMPGKSGALGRGVPTLGSAHRILELPITG
jgi:hypothetical protein